MFGNGVKILFIGVTMKMPMQMGSAWVKSTTDKRIIRGGSTNIKAEDCRLIHRNAAYPSSSSHVKSSDGYGFRIVRQ